MLHSICISMKLRIIFHLAKLTGTIAAFLRYLKRLANQITCQHPLIPAPYILKQFFYRSSNAAGGTMMIVNQY
jgi:hypothetical protein